MQSYLIRFINSQKSRIENKEIAEGTLRNYIKAIKLFFSMNDIIINWKKLSKEFHKYTLNRREFPHWMKVRNY